MSPGRAAGALAAVTMAVLLLPACGDDDPETDAAPAAADPGAGTALTVEAHDIDFDRDAYAVASGPVEIDYRQEGSLPHSLVIERAGGGAVDGFKLEVGDADSDRATAQLPPGDYVLYCDVPGHRDAGMEADLQVEAAP
jgi:plastocyanin